jgi:hypothetical protein
MEGGEGKEADRPTSDDKLVKKEGWVLKQGPPPWKTWKKRWLVLTPTGLSYFSPKGKENKYSLKGSVPASMIATVEIMAINKKKGIYGFKVDVPTRTYIFAPQPEKLSLSEKEAQGWVDTISHLIVNNQRRQKKQVQKVGTLTKKKKKREAAPAEQQPTRLQSVSQEVEPLSPRADASARMSRSQPAPSSSSRKNGSSRHSREKEKEKEKENEKEREREREREKRESKEDKEKKSRHRANSRDKRSPDVPKSDGKRNSDREKAKSDLKRLDEDRKAELTQVVEKYLKIRDAIVETLIAKEIALIAESHEHEKQAILAQIKIKSIQL